MNYIGIDRVCIGKIKFKSKEKAIEYNINRRKYLKHEMPTKQLYPYKCKFCGKWHLGGN